MRSDSFLLPLCFVPFSLTEWNAFFFVTRYFKSALLQNMCTLDNLVLHKSAHILGASCIHKVDLIEGRSSLSQM